MSSGYSTTDPHRRRAQAKKKNTHRRTVSPSLSLTHTHTPYLSHTLSLDRHPPFVPPCMALEQHHDIVFRPLPLFLALTQITLHHGHPLLLLFAGLFTPFSRSLLLAVSYSYHWWHQTRKIIWRAVAFSISGQTRFYWPIGVFVL